MSWSYSGNPKASKLDECRFMIGDVVQSTPLMQDEEIQFIIDSYTTDNTILYQLFMRAATLFARDIKRTLGPQTEDPTERLKFFNEQAKYYRQQCAYSGLSVPAYAYPKVFKKGMLSNTPYGGDSDV